MEVATEVVPEAFGIDLAALTRDVEQGLVEVGVDVFLVVAVEVFAAG